MSVLENAHAIPGGPDELDRVARELHGRAYVTLSDAEAAQVWDVIEARETG